VCQPARSGPPTDGRADARTADPTPLSVRQLVVLASCATRELVWGLRLVARELRIWRAHARLIPDQSIRTDALRALACKRGNIDGAALFWIIPSSRNPCLLKLLVAYQVMWDFLDSASETGASAGQSNGRQLHLALVDAVDPERPISDYYGLHPWTEDAGYLRALVEVCRRCSERLPSFESIRPLLVREAYRANVQAINHDNGHSRQAAALREWVAREYPPRDDIRWFELAAAAGAGLSIYALFALAVEPQVGGFDAIRIYNAYFPWASALATMLDSYVDQDEDTKNGDHIYIGHYRSPENAAIGIRRLVRRSVLEAGALPNGERHVLLVTCMIAMYLSKDSAHVPVRREVTQALVGAGGLLTRMMLPILRLWRIAYAQQAG
jgi:tetraprenyl-beta-curcumene synthase